jgi:hypothetical protein
VIEEMGDLSMAVVEALSLLIGHTLCLPVRTSGVIGINGELDIVTVDAEEIVEAIVGHVDALGVVVPPKSHTDGQIRGIGVGISG